LIIICRAIIFFAWLEWLLSGTCGDCKGFFGEDLRQRLSFSLILLIKGDDVFSNEFIAFAVAFIKIDFSDDVLEGFGIRIFSMSCHELAQAGIVKPFVFKFVVFISFWEGKLAHQF
jgi:hypothetical protein